MKIDHEITRNTKFPLNLGWKMLHFVPTFNGAYHHTPKKRHTCKLCHEHNNLTTHTSSHLAPTKLENRWSKYSHPRCLNCGTNWLDIITLTLAKGFPWVIFHKHIPTWLEHPLLVLPWVEMSIGGLDA